MNNYAEFLRAHIVLDTNGLVHEHVQEALLQLPSSVRIRGDAVSLDYAIEDGIGVVRLRLREGQAHQLMERDVPELDRPIRYTVVRGGDEAIRAGSLQELKARLKGLSSGRKSGPKFSGDGTSGGKKGGSGKGGRHKQRHHRRDRH